MKKIIITEEQYKILNEQIGLAGNHQAEKLVDNFKKIINKLGPLMVRYDDGINSYQDLTAAFQRMIEYHIDSHNYTGFMDAIIPELDRKRNKKQKKL